MNNFSRRKNDTGKPGTDLKINFIKRNSFLIGRPL
jgi:hypothetical protein